VLISGCSHTRQITHDRVGTDLALEQDAEAIEGSAEKIDSYSSDPQIGAETVVLKTVASGLYSKAAVNKKIIEYIGKLEEKIKAYEADEKRRTTTIFIILLSVGVLSLTGGIAIIIFGSQAGMSGLGIQLVAMGVALCGISYVMIYYAWIALTIGLAVLGGGVIYLIYKYIRAAAKMADSSASSDKSLLEIIRSFDIVKELGWNRQSKAVVNSVQSPETQKLVNKVKENDKGK
jgi:hypothetical protein